jgi:glycosyltransferase involved in cell wall biosynthesis
MNLAIVIPSLEKYGGAERFLVECVSRWQHRHAITLYATAFNGALLDEHGITRVERRLLSPYFSGEHAPLLNAVLLPKIWRREIGRHDLYHTHLWPTHLIDLHPLVWYAHEPMRAIHDLRFESNSSSEDGETDLHIYPKAEYDSVANARRGAFGDAISAIDRSAAPERIVANSRYSAAYLSDVYGRAVDDVVYPGAPAPGASAPRLALRRDPGLFVTISQLWSHKRIRVLIEAIALTDGTQLLIMGSGPEQTRLQELIVGLGLEDRVFILSGLSNNELSLVLARACAFLFCPIKEPFGIVVLEAMAAALPVIAVEEGGYIECCSSDCAFLVPPFPSAFAEKIALLQADPALAEKMGRAAQERAALYTWDRTEQELEAILVETAAAHAGPAPPAAEPARTLFGIQYYVWYGDGFGAAHWSDARRTGHVSDRPLIGYYGSTRGETIRFHLGLFEQMALDFVILNLHVDETGINPIEWQAIEHVFSIAEGRKLRLAVQLAPYTDRLPTLTQCIAQIQERCATSPLYLRLKEKPILFWFWSGALDRRRELILELAQASAGFTNLAAGLRLPDEHSERDLTFGLFAGFAPFSPLELAPADKWKEAWDAAYTAADRAGLPYRMATVCPGYDDHALDDPRRSANRFRQVPRRDGETYARSIAWLESLAPAPDLAIVATFNEMHENTHIEPTARNGNRYIDMTRDFIARIKQAQGCGDAS